MQVSKEKRQAMAAKRRRRTNGQFAEEPDKPKAVKKKNKTSDRSKYSATTQAFIDKGRKHTNKHLGDTRELAKVYQEKLALKKEIDTLAERYGTKGADKVAIGKEFEIASRKLSTLDSNEESIGESLMSSVRNSLLKDDKQHRVTIDSSVKKEVEPAELKKEVGGFFSLTKGRGSNSLKEIVLEEDRAWADASTGKVNIGKHSNALSRNQALYHELGHHVEFESKDIQKVSQDFVRARATGLPEPLAKITGNKAYRADEIAYPGKYINPYVGKIYPSGYTEVVSTGLEHFSRPLDMYRLYKKDPEHFYLMVGILNG